MPFRRFRRARARYEWVGVQQITPISVAVGALNTQGLLPPVVLEEWPRGSLVRVIGSLFVSPATAPAAPSGYGVHLGLIWEAQAASSVSYDPDLSPEAPWKWWHVLFPQIGGTAAADSNASRWIGYFPIHFDLKQHTRYGEMDQYSLKVKNNAASAAAIQFSYSFRFLIRAGR